MQKRIAIKRLTASDLTLFSWQFRNQNAGNQKAINLNADVFISELFPSLPDALGNSDGRVPLDLSIYGPGNAGLHNLQRKILKGPTYKNWRLDGELINNPDDSPARYDVLQPGDFAVFEFSGRVLPTSAKLILISQALLADQAIYASLRALVGNRTMAAVSGKQLEEMSERLERSDHPFHQITFDADLEDASLGGAAGRQALWRRPISRSVSRVDLENARDTAVEVGRLGEELVFAYLQHQQSENAVKGFRWESDINAAAPYDFLITLRAGQELALDVKATNGSFGRPIHISFAELTEMAGPRRYDLYRIFEISDQGCKLRIAESVNAFAATVIERLSGIPDGVQVDSVSVAPSALLFGPPIDLVPPPPEEPVAIE